MPDSLRLIAQGALLLAGLLGPGAALLRALRLPFAIGPAFLGSVAVHYTTLLALVFTGLTISLVSISAGLSLAAFAALAYARLRPPAAPVGPDFSALEPTLPAWRRRLGPLGDLGAWTPLYIIFWAALLVRAWHQPLAGPDVEFRWSYLAEQMLRLGHLDFYPPRHATDFRAYFWAESLPPGAAALHAWAYACAGGVGKSVAWTVPATVLQLWTLHEFLWLAAQRLSRPPAARLVVLAAAACPLLTWSVLLGQETGLTALAAAGIVLGLAAWQATSSPGWLVFVGLAALVGAAAREYGLVFPLLAAGGLWLVRAPRIGWLACGVPLLLAAFWPLRTWFLTGNPFYSLALGPLPVNPRFIAWINHDAAAFAAALTSSAGWRELGRYALQYAPTALLGAIVLLPAALRRNVWRREAIALLVAVGVIALLWAASVRYTSGGLFYSLRVLAPALALGVLALGLALASVARLRPEFFRGLRVALFVLVLGTLPASLSLPLNPARTPWREWPAFNAIRHAPTGIADETAALLQRLGSDGAILADAPGFQTRFLPLGRTVVPLWSPDADWLFDNTLSEADVVARWRASGIRWIVITKWQANLDFFNRHSRWSRPPLRLQPVGETAQTAVFALSAASAP